MPGLLRTNSRAWLARVFPAAAAGRSGAAAPSGATGRGRGRGRSGGGSGGGPGAAGRPPSRWTTGSAAAASERGEGRFEPLDLVPQLAEPSLYFFHRTVNKIWQRHSPYRGVNVRTYTRYTCVGKHSQRGPRPNGQERSSSVFRRASELCASRSESPPTITRLATVPRTPPGALNSFVYSNVVAPSPSSAS